MSLNKKKAMKQQEPRGPVPGPGVQCSDSGGSFRSDPDTCWVCEQPGKLQDQLEPRSAGEDGGGAGLRPAAALCGRIWPRPSCCPECEPPLTQEPRGGRGVAAVRAELGAPSRAWGPEASPQAIPALALAGSWSRVPALPTTETSASLSYVAELRCVSGESRCAE